MEKLTNKAARQYLRRVRGLLPCSRKDKDRITGPLRQSISDFLAEQPEADAALLRERFGPPDTIAAACLENANVSNLLRRLKTKRRIVAIVISAAVLLLLTWGFFILQAQIRLHDYIYHSYSTETIEIISRDTSQ